MRRLLLLSLLAVGCQGSPLYVGGYVADDVVTNEHGQQEVRAVYGVMDVAKPESTVVWCCAHGQVAASGVAAYLSGTDEPGGPFAVTEAAPELYAVQNMSGQSVWCCGTTAMAADEVAKILNGEVVK